MINKNKSKWRNIHMGFYPTQYKGHSQKHPISLENLHICLPFERHEPSSLSNCAATTLESPKEFYPTSEIWGYWITSKASWRSISQTSYQHTETSLPSLLKPFPHSPKLHQCNIRIINTHRKQYMKKLLIHNKLF